MSDPLKPRDKITQKMSREGLQSENQTTGETKRISKREQDADLLKTPEQQAAQDAAQAIPISTNTAPCPNVINLRLRQITQCYIVENYPWIEMAAT